MRENDNIGAMLRKKRELLGLSQQEIGDYVGVSRSAVSRWESGEIENMGIQRIKLLSEKLKISPLAIIMNNEVEEVEEDLSTEELATYFKNNKEKLSSLSKEDSQKLIKLIDLYLD